MHISDFPIPSDVLLLCDILVKSGFEAYLVGGCVRDRIMGVIPADYDITTSCLPQDIARIFSSRGFQVIPTGIRYGTMSVVVQGTAYEITTYRSEQGYSDGRHPDNVFFLGDLHADLLRRDFTINAMAFDPLKSALIDLFGGRTDITAGVVRAVGDPQQRFNEDFLRMLRAVRYASRFSYLIEPCTLSAIKDCHSGIFQVSQERIFNELLKMASQPGSRFADALILLKDTGLWADILPELDRMPLLFWERTLSALRLNTETDPVLNFAILFHNTFCEKSSAIRDQNDVAVLSRIAGRMKMSNHFKDVLIFTSLHHELCLPESPISNHQLVDLMRQPFWSLLYRTSSFYYSVECPAGSPSWQELENRIKVLHRFYFEEGNLDAVRRLINGERVMRVKESVPGPDIGRYIDATIKWILDNGIDINETSVIDCFIQKL